MLLDKNIYGSLAGSSKKVAVLIDPDKANFKHLDNVIEACEQSGVSFIFFGGSLLTSSDFNLSLTYIKNKTNLPIVLFPGSSFQVSDKADAILWLSLISGRNPEYLIGQHVQAAPLIKQTSLEVIPTGYMLVESGSLTTAQYISNTLPIPHHKPEIAAVTALAGKLSGLKAFYLDTGSGAKKSVSTEMIQAVSNEVELPVIVGGGISQIEQVELAFGAGANCVVIGTAIEKSPSFLGELSSLIKYENNRYIKP